MADRYNERAQSISLERNNKTHQLARDIEHRENGVGHLKKIIKTQKKPVIVRYKKTKSVEHAYINNNSLQVGIEWPDNDFDQSDDASSYSERDGLSFQDEALGDYEGSALGDDETVVEKKDTIAPADGEDSLVLDSFGDAEKKVREESIAKYNTLNTLRKYKSPILESIDNKTLSLIQAESILNNKCRYNFTSQELSKVELYYKSLNIPSSPLLNTCNACGTSTGYCRCSQ
ncbi:MAG: hypothetical protein Q9M92_10560 [Enterobacterales bacterium]|nr:hypothetical protein [Enterobacterales bacterium]